MASAWVQDARWLEAAGAGPLRGVWDTQVAAGVLGLVEGCTPGGVGSTGVTGRQGRPLLGPRIGLAALLQQYGLPVATEKEAVSKKLEEGGG